MSDDGAEEDLTAERRDGRDAESLDALRLIARRVAVAERIAHRTTDRAASEVAERLADIGVGMAVHPAAIRERGASVIEARTRLAQSEQMLEAHDANAAGDDARAAVPKPPPAVVAEAAVPLARKRGSLGFLRRSKESPIEDTRESTELLRAIGAAADDAFGARRAFAAREDQRALLVARQTSALEVVRVAEHDWHDLAGEGADPADIDSVVRRLDPRHQDAILAAQEMVSVRAAATVFEDAMAAWQSAWTALGLEAPTPADAEAAVDRLSAEATQTEIHVDDAVDHRIDLTEPMPDTMVVVGLELADS